MWRDLNITKQDWERTPAAVRSDLAQEIIRDAERKWESVR
jgi:hypothetical protein